jgi:hypothetical protein
VKGGTKAFGNTYWNWILCLLLPNTIFESLEIFLIINSKARRWRKINGYTVDSVGRGNRLLRLIPRV